MVAGSLRKRACVRNVFLIRTDVFCVLTCVCWFRMYTSDVCGGFVCIHPTLGGGIRKADLKRVSYTRQPRERQGDTDILCQR